MRATGMEGGDGPTEDGATEMQSEMGKTTEQGQSKTDFSQKTGLAKDEPNDSSEDELPPPKRNPDTVCKNPEFE